MVRRYEAARADPYLAAQIALRARGVVDPSIDEEADALLDAEFKLRVVRFLSGNK